MKARHQQRAAALAGVLDTREPTGSGWETALPDDVRIIRSTLKAGDLSLEGFESRAAVERKTPADLLQCLTHDRPRFLGPGGQVERLAALDLGVIVVEGGFAELIAAGARRGVVPAAIAGSVAAIVVDHGVAVLFAGHAQRAADLALRMLRRFAAATFATEEGGANVAA